MLNIDLNNLNPLEIKINETITSFAKDDKNIKIDKAAELCGCSVSKISKFVKKLGFGTYKQYMHFVYTNELPQKCTTNELDRIRKFVDDFDIKLVDRFIEEMNAYEKIILFGYGPSYICCQYFEYKLRLVTNKVVISVPDEVSAENLLDEKSILIILTTTGNFSSFQDIYNFAKSKGSNFLLIIEEFNTSVILNYDKVLILTDTQQPPGLTPYEKSRVVFFIFIEEVIHRLLEFNKKIIND